MLPYKEIEEYQQSQSHKLLSTEWYSWLPSMTKENRKLYDLHLMMLKCNQGLLSLFVTGGVIEG